MNKAQKITEALLEKLGVANASVNAAEENGVWKISISSEDEHTLVGRDGERFEAFSHLLKRMLAKELGEETRIIVDVNQLRAKQEEALKGKAGIIADRARAFKRDVEMEPMTSYERMVVHSHLEGAPNIKTESVGEGKSRRLIVKYVEE